MFPLKGLSQQFFNSLKFLICPNLDGFGNSHLLVVHTSGILGLEWDDTNLKI